MLSTGSRIGTSKSVFANFLEYDLVHDRLDVFVPSVVYVDSQAVKQVTKDTLFYTFDLFHFWHFNRENYFHSS